MVLHHLSALTVCVNYSDYLTHSLAAWRDGTDALTVVTTPTDTATLSLCHEHQVRVHTTDVFYARGAYFNKGAAIAEAFEQLEVPGWFLHFDADMIPPADWRAHLDHAGLQPGHLYGAWRDELDGSPVGDSDIAGFFHLAHSSDPNMQVRPIVPTHFRHAGNYDTVLQDRWPKNLRIRLDLHLIHQGQTWQNWCGRGNHEAMGQLLQARRRGKRWQDETLG